MPSGMMAWFHLSPANLMSACSSFHVETMTYSSGDHSVGRPTETDTTPSWDRTRGTEVERTLFSNSSCNSERTKTRNTRTIIDPSKICSDMPNAWLSGIKCLAVFAPRSEMRKRCQAFYVRCSHLLGSRY